MTPDTMTSPECQRVNGYNNAKIAPCIALLIAISISIGCGRQGGEPDVSHLDGGFELKRTEQVLFGLDTASTPMQVTEAFSSETGFWNLYFTVIMPPVPDSASDEPLSPDKMADKSHWQPIVSDPYLRAVYESVTKDYSDMSDVERQLEQAFQYLQYYFPGNRVPNVYTLISGFGYFPFIFEDDDRDGLGISMEMFLGADFPYRTFVGNVPVFSDYLIRTYNRDHMARKTIDVLAEDLIGPAPGERLIDMMIHNGIKLYVLEHLMPGLADTVLFEFTPAQLAWCNENERNLWAHFLKDDLMYSDEFSKIQKLINPSPGVPGMPAEAPGAVANWTGWRIIHALERQKSDLKLTDLLLIQDAQSVLEAARYRPK